MANSINVVYVNPLLPTADAAERQRLERAASFETWEAIAPIRGPAGRGRQTTEPAWKTPLPPAPFPVEWAGTAPKWGQQPAFRNPGLELTKGRGKGSKASTEGDGPGVGVATAYVGATVLGSSAVWHGMRAISTTSAVFEDFVITSGVAAEAVIGAGGDEAAFLFRRTVRTLYYSGVLLLVITALWKWRSSAAYALSASKGLTSKSSACIAGDGPRWSRTPTAPVALDWAWAPATPIVVTPLAVSDNDHSRWTDLRREISWESVSERLAKTRLVQAALTPLGFGGYHDKRHGS